MAGLLVCFPLSLAYSHAGIEFGSRWHLRVHSILGRHMPRFHAVLAGVRGIKGRVNIHVMTSTRRLRVISKISLPR